MTEAATRSWRDIAPATGKVPDFPQTRLALRCWQFDRERLVVRPTPPGTTVLLSNRPMSPCGLVVTHRGPYRRKAAAA
jgi:hypothetical protein